MRACTAPATARASLPNGPPVAPSRLVSGRASGGSSPWPLREAFAAVVASVIGPELRGRLKRRPARMRPIRGAGRYPSPPKYRRIPFGFVRRPASTAGPPRTSRRSGGDLSRRQARAPRDGPAFVASVDPPEEVAQQTAGLLGVLDLGDVPAAVEDDLLGGRQP